MVNLKGLGFPDGNHSAAFMPCPPKKIAFVLGICALNPLQPALAAFDCNSEGGSVTSCWEPLIYWAWLRASLPRSLGGLNLY